MTMILDAKTIAAAMRSEIAEAIRELPEKPTLAVVIVGIE